MADHFDVVVLGAGPGGYVAAIRAAQLGKSVAVVEKQYWGGVCLNVGCIPSKALLKNAELSHLLQHEKKKFGIEGDATMSYGPTHKRSRQVSAGIVKGVHFLMKKNKITEVDGWGQIGEKGKVTVELSDGGTKELTSDDLTELEQMLVASGGQQVDIAWATEQGGGLGIFVRSLIGLDRSAAIEAFENYLDGTRFSAAARMTWRATPVAPVKIRWSKARPEKA